MSTEALPSAAVTLEEIVAKDPSTALYLPVAERLLARGHVAQAILLCEERRSRPGKGIGDHVVLGRCYLADGRLAQAQDEFRLALDLDRENVVALKSMAGILSHEGRHAEAADLYRAVCRVDPGDLESQSALHQITSGEYADVRPPELIVSQSDVAWQPVRLTREEEHLSELGLGLSTFDTFDAPALSPLPRPRTDVERPVLLDVAVPPAPIAPKAAASRHEIIAGPVAKPGEEFHDRLGALHEDEFQSTALERLEQVLRPAVVRPLGEVGAVAPPAEERAAASPDDDEPIELPASALIDVSSPGVAPSGTSERRSAVWRDESAPRPIRPPSPAAPPAPAAPAASRDATVAPAKPTVPPADAADRPTVEGNRSAFETWLRRLGGNQ